MNDRLAKLRDHHIICGYGRLGRQIIRDLRARGERFVVIEIDDGLQEEMLERGVPHVIGDATADDVLLAAGVDRARGVVCSLDSDASNVLAILTVRGLNPDLHIVSRANDETSENKLRRAGADWVVSPAAMGGHRLALAILRPAVHDFLSRIFDFGFKLDVDVGQVTVPAKSPFAGQTIAECDLRRIRNVTILAIRAPDGEFTLNPNPQRVIEPGETLILIGPAGAVYDLEAMYSA